MSEITLTNYRRHFHSISRHFDIQQPMDALTKSKLEAMVVSMRKSGLAHNSISSYCRVLRTFLVWCQREGMTVPPMPHIKDKETVKEAYTDEELTAILKRPKKDCSFCEYRNWVIVNFLMNSGCRASTVRNIQNRNTSPDSENSETQSNNQSANGRESLTQAEIEEKVETEAMWYVMNHLENGPYSTVFDLDSTRYKIGSMVEFEDYKYEVNGTLYLSDRYGSVKGTATFTCSCIWINDEGDALGLGSTEVDVDY